MLLLPAILLSLATPIGPSPADGEALLREINALGDSRIRPLHQGDVLEIG